MILRNRFASSTMERSCVFIFPAVCCRRSVKISLGCCLLAEARVNSGGGARLEVGDLGDELDWALAGQEVVVGHARDGDHGKAAVLYLSELAAAKFTLFLLEAEGVEAEVTSAVDSAVGELEQEGDLEEADEKEDLPESTRLDGSLMEAPHLLALVPLGHEGEGVEVLDNGASSGKHAHAAVLDLSLAGPDHITDCAENATVDSPFSAIHVPVVAVELCVLEALHVCHDWALKRAAHL